MLSASTVSSNAFNTVMGDVFVYCLMRLFCVKPPRRARRHDSTAAAAFLAQRVDKVWSCCLLSGVCLCCRDEKSSAVVICTEDGHLRSPSRSLRDKVDDRQQAHPVLLSTTLCQRKPPVLRRPEAASHHSLATVAPSGGAGENGAATPVTAATTTHYTIITIITATTNATLIP